MMPNHMERDSKSPCYICGKYAKWVCDYNDCRNLICQEHATPEFKAHEEDFNKGVNHNFFTLCPNHKEHQVQIPL